MNPQYLNDLFTRSPMVYNLRDSQRLIQPEFNTFTYGFRSFRYYGAKIWNSIPCNIKETDSINVFKTKLTEWLYSDESRDINIFWYCVFGNSTPPGYIYMCVFVSVCVNV